MSIFTKVVILFFISLSLMLFVSSKTNKLTQDALESLLKEKYIKVSDELFKHLANNDIDKLNKKLKELNLKTIADKQHYFSSSKQIYKHETNLSSIKILQHEDNRYLLYMRYLDDEILMIDISQNKNLNEKEFLNYLIIADILILVILFLIILKMIYPLKNISKNIKKFGDGEYSSRVNVSTNDEIGELAIAFNSMAKNLEELIDAREMLLRDIAHELKTPIAKSKLAIEMIDDNTKYKKILHTTMRQMDEMTHELLHIEKLNANIYTLNLENFSAETLLSEALSKLFIADEDSIQVKIVSNFTINGDLNYLSIALKNLIDNGLKYSIEKPIYIVVEDNKIDIKSVANKLDKPLEYYCQVFTQGNNSRTEVGYGLGLSLVKRILDKHNFNLSYKYDNKFNIFTIII